ncbi:MAG: hypothetical protein CL678_02840 [Bdellovibrionaceae bacterium]|nr:hypothetical protein [Pseudobdellovibrionaceae bacterium]|tara:strand:+ start:397 stop:1242 length:846 start_codon:yes stop_codon:yes gene_type:complete
MSDFAVIGDPIEHSLSPWIFEQWKKKDPKFESFQYEKVRIHSNDLMNYFNEIKFQQKYKGWNITTPHKSFFYLHCDELTEQASAVGAVNVVRFEGSKAIGHNTDIDGILSTLDSFQSRYSNAIVFGSGGASRAVCFSLGLRNCTSVLIYCRNSEHGKKIVDFFSKIFPNTIWNFKQWNVEEQVRSDFDLYINATSAELIHPEFQWNVEFHKKSSVFDLSYGKNKSNFLKKAELANCFFQDGSRMLIAQALASYKFWLNTLIDLKEIDAIKELWDKKFKETV